ncbi:MAG: hypothetical protein U0234_26050 [Sandaracinus sp.]
MRTHRSWLALSWIAALGCGSATQSADPASGSSPPASTSATSEAPPPPSSAAAPAGAPYALHEWGVVDVAPSGVVEIAAGAGQPQRPVSVRKPVLYVHLLDGLAEQTFGLDVTLASGSFSEHVPDATITGTTLSWPHVVARATHCAYGGASARRSPVPVCASTDGICEVEELPRYDASTAACLDVNGTSTGLLFYRGAAPSAALPLSLRREPSGSVTVTASRGEATHGTLMRVSVTAAGVVVSRAAAPGAGASASLPVGTEPLSRAQGLEALRAPLGELGLDAAETDAFFAGWADELFGAEPGAARETRDRGYAGDPSGPRASDAVLYFLAPSAVDAIATLHPTPAPRELRRAFLVRVDLGPLAVP